MSLCVAIAALGDGHVDILAELAEILMDPERARALREADDRERSDPAAPAGAERTENV